MKTTIRQTLALAAFAAAASAAQAADITVPIHAVDAAGTGKALGNVTISETAGGLTFTPALTGLPPGPRGFHVHAKGDCSPAETDGKKVPAGAAGGHLDPHDTKAHHGPGKAEKEGHAGDLPRLEVAADGSAKTPVQAAQLKTLADVKGRALMIHAGGDNYADQPAPLGGGGARIACGVIGG
jgi:Cu-Zn family superoxide dismutase